MYLNHLLILIRTNDNSLSKTPNLKYTYILIKEYYEGFVRIFYDILCLAVQCAQLLSARGAGL